MFLLTQKKAIGSVKSSKQYHFCFICAFSVHNLISIWFCNLHSIYKLFKMPFCKKIKNVFWHKFFFGLVFFVPIAIGISIIFFEVRSSFNECDLHNWHNSLVNAFFFNLHLHLNRTKCVLNKFVLCTNQKQPLQSFWYENHCEWYKKLASKSWPVLLTLIDFFLWHALFSSVAK